MQNTVFSYLKKNGLLFVCVQGGRLALKCVWKLQPPVFTQLEKEKSHFYLFMYFLPGFKPFHDHLRGWLPCGVNTVLLVTGALAAECLRASIWKQGCLSFRAAAPFTVCIACSSRGLRVVLGPRSTALCLLVCSAGANELGSPRQKGASRCRDCSVFASCDAVVRVVCICDSK